MDTLRSFQLLSLFFLVFTFSASVFAFNMPRLGTQRKTTQHEPQTTSSISNLQDLKTYYYTQTLDHFNYRPYSYTTFKQRYVINSRYWGGANASAPIFAYLGAEESLDDDLPIIGFLSDNAPRFKALQVYIEHRYYGKSVPFGSMEAALKNGSIRGYFNSVQAIADYAAVFLHIKKKISAENSPVIVVGGSYGGMLASWFRLKYPHIALGAVAASAPILYFDTIAPQAGYYSIVTKDFKETSESCYETIRESWAEIDRVASKPHYHEALVTLLLLLYIVESRPFVSSRKDTYAVNPGVSTKSSYRSHFKDYEVFQRLKASAEQHLRVFAPEIVEGSDGGGEQDVSSQPEYQHSQETSTSGCLTIIIISQEGESVGVRGNGSGRRGDGDEEGGDEESRGRDGKKLRPVLDILKLAIMSIAIAAQTSGSAIALQANGLTFLTKLLLVFVITSNLVGYLCCMISVLLMHTRPRVARVLGMTGFAATALGFLILIVTFIQGLYNRE